VERRLVHHSYTSISFLFSQIKDERNLLKASIFIFTKNVVSLLSSTGQHCYWGAGGVTLYLLKWTLSNVFYPNSPVYFRYFIHFVVCEVLLIIHFIHL